MKKISGNRCSILSRSKMSFFKKMTAVALVISMLAALSGCASGAGSSGTQGPGQTADAGNTVGSGKITGKVVNLKEGLSFNLDDIAVERDTAEKIRTSVGDFSLKLMRQLAGKGENCMISPVSLLAALVMVENGAEGDTLAEFTDLIGTDLTTFNQFFGNYLLGLNSLINVEMNAANSIWIREGFDVKKDFLETNAKYYKDTGIFQAPFDKTMVDGVNDWVKKNTYGMIPKLIDSISEADMLYLVNAIAMKAQWEKEFKGGAKINFAAQDSESTSVDAMSSTEGLYIADGRTEGFIKPYKGGISFAALRPEDGMSVDEYISSLTGEKLQAIIEGASSVPVDVVIPKFESTFSTELKDILSKAGIKKMFSDGEAQFGRISDERLFVSGGLHKTYIRFYEKGTDAAAATGMTIGKASAPIDMPRRIVFDRPFVYVIFDDDNRMPIFIGTYERP